MFIYRRSKMASDDVSGGTPGFGFQHHDEPDDFEVDIGAPDVDGDNDEDFDNRTSDDKTATDVNEDSDPSKNSSDVVDESVVSSVSTEFKPYAFKGKVNGEETAQEFKTQKELDRTIANGLLAPKMHQAYTTLQKEVGQLRKDADWANGLLDLAKNSPVEFFTHVVEELISEDQLAEYVWNKSQHYTKLANMTPDDRKRHDMSLAAEKILKDQAHAAEMAAEAKEQQEKARIAQEKVQAQAWKAKEIAYWSSRLPENAHGKIEDYMRYVAAYAEKQLDHNPSYSFKDMSKELARMLEPLKATTQSSSSMKKEELANNKARTQQETDKLRKLGEQGTTEQKARSTAEAFRMAKSKIFAQLNK